MPLSPNDIVNDDTYIHDGSGEERVAKRKTRVPLVIVEPNPAWEQRFLDAKARIETVLCSTALEILHAGSTSVPGLPAKDIIDMDLVVPDPKDEESYVGALESVGFRLLLREPGWHDHRFIVDEGDRPGAYLINLHVFGPDCPAVARHRIFRDWLLKTPQDVQLYAATKRECAAISEAAGETMNEYSARKDKVIREIRARAFRDLGYIK
jgi:GrpB-like predicted nucleotidyltransferase (UPF0157 family)